MANPNLGEIECKWHGMAKVTAFVRLDRKGRLYVFCEVCGIHAPRLEAFQEYIKDRAVFYDGIPDNVRGGAAVAERKEEPAKQAGEQAQAKDDSKELEKAKNQATESITKEKPQQVKKSSLLNGFFNALNAEEE